MSRHLTVLHQVLQVLPYGGGSPNPSQQQSPPGAELGAGEQPPCSPQLSTYPELKLTDVPAVPVPPGSSVLYHVSLATHPSTAQSAHDAPSIVSLAHDKTHDEAKNEPFLGVI